MKEPIYEAMENLFDVLKKEAPEDAVSCEVFINHTGYEWSIKCRSATNLKDNGISMRNIAGKWIV
jgi:hypothetical protein